MIISTYDFNINEFVKNIDNPDFILGCIKDSIPEEYKHIDAIYNNTRYYVNTLVLQDKKLDYSIKAKLSDILTSRIKVVGYLKGFVAICDVEKFVDMDRVSAYIKGDV